MSTVKEEERDLDKTRETSGYSTSSSTNPSPGPSSVSLGFYLIPLGFTKLPAVRQVAIVLATAQILPVSLDFNLISQGFSKLPSSCSSSLWVAFDLLMPLDKSVIKN